MSLEEREHRSALRTVALLSGQVWEEIGEVSAALSALRAEAQSVAAQSHGSEAVEVEDHFPFHGCNHFILFPECQKTTYLKTNALDFQIGIKTLTAIVNGGRVVCFV